MQAGTWPNPPHADEYAVRFDRGRKIRVLVVPALFDEGNKLRHFTVETMRALDDAGVDTMLPDLPGTNESLVTLESQTLGTWRDAMTSAAKDFSATCVLTVRGGGLCAPPGLPVLQYAPVAGSSILRGMIRARILADLEAGSDVTQEVLLERGSREGLTLAGYPLASAMIDGLQAASSGETDIAQSELGGPGLWLRAEPDHDPVQAEALARSVAEKLS